MDGLVTVEVDNIGMTNVVYLFFIVHLKPTICGSLKTGKFKILYIIIAAPYSEKIYN